ncbi:hypothetical protein QQY79_01545 [Flavobacterium tructae]|uniref:AAA family ATPase n=1 Tax=Flavobacterium tructae TaxID=1114873 RepID=UPI002551EF9D|nr:hypothetical protein [Flavobacterium tructae]MDL2141189.1 hypothetical protein [Flavobacterium tructae]
MKATVEYKRFFAYSEEKNKYFNTEFRPGINLIHGKNTSGKSTVMQAIQYTFGINDERHKLSEVLSENVIFRLDFVIKKDVSEKITIIRDDEFIYVKIEGKPIRKFTGITGNSSAERRILKQFMSDLFGFDLFLESSGEYKLASLETMFLPYYIAQDTGWVMKLKSFRDLDFYKNFKTDFYDYYLGIKNIYDRDEKQRLESERKQFKNEIKFLSEVESENEELQLSKLYDEMFFIKSISYVEVYKTNKEKLIKAENDHLESCNQLTFLTERNNVLKKIKKALLKQNPLIADCPTCYQNLPNTVDKVYEFYQNLNDTEKQLTEINKNSAKIKDLKSDINSFQVKIDKLKKTVQKDYNLLLEYNAENLTYSSWIDNKANIKLSENILLQIGKKTIELGNVEEKLLGFKTEEEIAAERRKKDFIFKTLFKSYLSELEVKKFEEEKCFYLYKMASFPNQGVELLMTLLAYNFAFNKLILNTDYVHRFPFMMDAIFKEDIEDSNKILILKFIQKNKPLDTQILISIADSDTNITSASDYNEKYLNNEAKLILIDNGKKRAFLHDYEGQFESYLEETILFME